jgi:hypothetical protein
MKTGEFGEDAKEMERNRCAGEIVDEPAEFGVVFHPLEEANDVRLSEVVGKKRADDEVNRLFRLPSKDVGRDPKNGGFKGAGFGGNGDGVRVKVETGELDRDTACASPALDAAEGIAVTAADIDDVKRLNGGRCGDGIEPTQQRAVSEEPAIEARKVAEASAELVARAGLIHEFGEFGELGAMTEIDRVKRHGTSWFPR